MMGMIVILDRTTSTPRMIAPRLKIARKGMAMIRPTGPCVLVSPISAVNQFAVGTVAARRQRSAAAARYVTRGVIISVTSLCLRQIAFVRRAPAAIRIPNATA